MLRNFANGILLGSLSIPMLVQATSGEVDASPCRALGQAVLGAVHASGDEMRAVACRTVMKESVTLVAVAHKPAGDAMRPSGTLPIHVAIIGMKHEDVRATGQIGIAEDSEQEIDESSLVWDDTPLELASGRSGYVLRLAPAYHPSGAAESGHGPSMTLFLAEKGRMRPVLSDLYLSSWDQTCAHPPCNHDEVTTRVFTTTYFPGVTSSHGLKDIVLTTTMDDDSSTMKRRILRFDGVRYSIPD